SDYRKSGDHKRCGRREIVRWRRIGKYIHSDYRRNMMGTYNSAILTNAGQSLIANAISGGGVVQFTSVQTSSYAYPSETDIPALTELLDVRQTAEPSSAQVFNNTIIQISSRF